MNFCDSDKNVTLLSAFNRNHHTICIHENPTSNVSDFMPPNMKSIFRYEYAETEDANVWKK